MLKRLELLGFKSFADKTEFTFGSGITAIVGPNGSGKSNVVDAIRWIMGEQSAKSLRGGEMTDVIFNGSSTRKSLGLAEVTLVLDNRQRRLAFESDEVQITRRVYRDGQGEYLINKQPSRLRDIKDLFLGSGAGADAYCIIAQGKVDALLQASNHERRQVFEEAAGISRFRAKKIESQRKLEQVELNLQRVRDIMEELRRQLHGVQLQASKARKYQEYQGLLRDKLTTVSLHEFHRWHVEKSQVEASLQELREQLAQQQEQAERLEAAHRELEQQWSEAEEQIRRAEADLASLRERQAVLENTLRHEQALVEQKQQERQRAQERRDALESLLQDLRQRVQACQAEWEEVETRRSACEQAVTLLQGQHDDLAQRLKLLRRRHQEDQAKLLEVMREAARSHNEWVSLKAHGQNLEQHRQRLHQRFDQANLHLSQMDQEVRVLEDAERDTMRQWDQARAHQTAMDQQAEALRQQIDQLREELMQGKALRHGLLSQAQLLEALARNHEGLNPLAVHILERTEQSPTFPWNQVYGVLADWLEVVPEYASLIDLLLAEKTQSILIKDQATLEAILQELAEDLAGRADFILLDHLAPQPPSANGEWTNSSTTASSPGLHSPVSEATPGLQPEDVPGWIGPMDRLVVCPRPDAAGLVESLLNRTYLVQDLETALLMSHQFPEARWVTPLGERCEKGSHVCLGQAKTASGMLSRKSQYRDLQEQMQHLDERLQQQEQHLNQLQEQASRQADQCTHSQQNVQVLEEQLADLRSRLAQHRERSSVMSQEVHWGRKELQQLEEEWNQVQNQLEQALAKAQSADARVQELQRSLEQGTEASVQYEQQLHQLYQQLTQAKVDAATVDEKRAAAAALLQQVTQQEQNLREEWDRLLQQQQAHSEQIVRGQQALADGAAQRESLQSQYEAAQARLLEWQSRGAKWREDRQRLLEASQQFRSRWQEQLDQKHQLELRCNDAALKQDHLCSRMQEELEWDLRAAHANYTPPEAPLDLASMHADMADLKKKIHRLGSINLDALQELHELEARAAHLQTQHDDLVQAKTALDEILEKINGDSRRLFISTFDAVRQHFQDLFRKLFGGGLADIVLENPEDVLESGIEIIARPPGKEARHLSLLSGGEKALTAVALLLAIFRNKPSPFCIMDEVDAALDEANVGRFAAVLREFLDLSQFIIISHSKKTMAAADVLYGVTMQEAGVSKRMAVRLEEAATQAEPSPALAA